MTWNVWWRFGPDWRARQPLILDTLRRTEADVIGLQEAWGTSEADQASELGAALGMHSVFAYPSLPPEPEPPETADQEGVVVGLGLISRWPIRSVQRRRLPSRHRPFQPLAIDAIIDHPAGPLRVINACFEWERAFDADRLDQANCIAGLAAEPPEDGPTPTAVIGDLNAAPGSQIYETLRGHLIDAWQAGGGAADAVTLSSTHPSAPTEVVELIDQRIDHIFFRPARLESDVRVTKARLAGDQETGGQLPSDHRAVVCDVLYA